MKKRVLLMSLSLFVMAPAVFGNTFESGETRRLKDIPVQTRLCNENGIRDVSALSGSRDSDRRDDGVRVGYGDSALGH